MSDTYCHLCNAKFHSRENYHAHMRCTHPLVSSTKSSDASSLSAMPSTLPFTTSEKSDDLVLNEFALVEKTIWCEKCKRSFDTPAMYLQHYSFQHCLQIIKCLQCQDVFETIEAFFSHIESTHPSKTGEPAASTRTLHVASHSLVETFKCKLCNATYKHRIDFLHHLQTVHKSLSVTSSPSPPSYQCSLCPCQLNTSNELLEHLKYIHHDLHVDHRRPSFNTLFPCRFCSMKFSSRFELNQHILHDHDDERRDTAVDNYQNGRKSSECTPHRIRMHFPRYSLVSSSRNIDLIERFLLLL